MKVSLVSYDDGASGSGKSASKLQDALHRINVDSCMYVAMKTRPGLETRLMTSTGGRLRLRLLQEAEARICTALHPHQRSFDGNKHSLGLFGAGVVSALNSDDSDIVQLMFVNGVLSIADIARIRKPIVWRLSDMWAFSGTGHYDFGDAASDWKTGYRTSRAADQWFANLIDLDRRVWKRKARLWREPIHIVCPSQWLADCVQTSALMKSWPVHVIPTSIDTSLFRPIPKMTARRLLGLKLDAPYILYSALGGTSDKRKGGDLFIEAVEGLAHSIPDLNLMFVGGQRSTEIGRFPEDRVYEAGVLNDPLTLALHYSAADLTVIPSRQDNLPQVGVEAQSCGCPVVAFDVSGLSELIDNGKTGALASPFDCADLRRAVQWCLADRARLKHLGKAARKRAQNKFDRQIVATSYRSLYEHVLSGNRTAKIS